MNPRRIAVKFFVSPDPEAAADLEPFIPMFHRFIQQSSVEGLLLDVANYQHVPDGPGVVLIGHEVDYAMDATAGKLGLLTVRKRTGEVPLADVLRDALAKALGAVREIEADGASKLAFALDTVKIEVLDRAAAPNDAAAAEAAKKAVAPVLAALYGEGTKVEIEAAGGDPRAPLALTARASEAADAATLLSRLGGGQGKSSGKPAKDVPGPAVPGQTEWDVSVEQLQHLRETGADFVLVDVREQHEVEICEIGGQVIPLGSIEARHGELDKDAHIIVHCHLGGRSGQATKFLRANGYHNAWNLQGGIRAWIQRIDPSLQDY